MMMKLVGVKLVVSACILSRTKKRAFICLLPHPSIHPFNPISIQYPYNIMKAHFSHVIQLILIYILSVLCGLLLVDFECSNYGYIHAGLCHLQLKQSSKTHHLFNSTIHFNFRTLNPFFTQIYCQISTQIICGHIIFDAPSLCVQKEFEEKRREENQQKETTIL